MLQILKDILEENEFPSQLLEDAQSQHIKDQLFANTERYSVCLSNYMCVCVRAIEAGVCGVPSFQVNGGEIVWGQDRLHVIADMLCGWRDTNSKL